MIYAAIYTRISSSLQRTNYSLESQIDSCTRHAAANQLQVIQMFQDIASGTQLDRPGLNALRDTVRAGKLKAVLVHSADRLTRRAAHMVLLQQELADQGVTLYVVQSQSSTFSVDTLVMEAAFAEAEHDQMRERLQRGQQQRHSVGQAHGNKLPFGYCYSDASRTTIVIDDIRLVSCGTRRHIPYRSPAIGAEYSNTSRPPQLLRPSKAAQSRRMVPEFCCENRRTDGV
jgi:site-specific DNA recombinase